MDKRTHAFLTVVSGLGVVMATVTGWLIPAYAAVVAGAPFALAAAYRSLMRKELDVNVLMVVAAIGSVFLGHVVEAGVLLFLFSLAATLEEFAMARTQSAIESLVALRPDSATLIDGGQEREVAVEDLRRGDTIRVMPFSQVPIDAVVTRGESSVDNSSMTGESEPVEVRSGAHVFAGTQNLAGAFDAVVDAEVGSTQLDKVVALVKEAQESKGSGEKLSHWFGQTFTLAVVGAFVVSFLVRILIGQEPRLAAYGALALLVALSPCALVISVPATTLSALAWAARRGMLVRGGKVVEMLGRVTTVALDKTGTLTLGKPQLAELCVCEREPVTAASGSKCLQSGACWHGGAMAPESRRVLGVAAAVEQYSDHPIAAAILEAAREHGCEFGEATGVSVEPGYGVKATLDGIPAMVGQPRFFQEIPPHLRESADDMRDKGMTVAILSYADSFAALGVRDTVRSSATDSVQRMRQLGIKRVAMLTGDNERTAQAVASEVGIDEVYAGLLPQEKEAWVREIEASGERVLFVGDGVNDAPSLTRATVGVGMGGLGSDIALQSSSVVLMHNDLAGVSDLIRLGRRANRVITANLVFASAVVVLLTVMTFVLERWWPGQRNLVLPLAVIGHEGSTAIVVLNGIRLLRGP